MRWTSLQTQWDTAVRTVTHLARDYSAVQDAAAIESMRRILRTFWVFGPTELALAWWYWRYPVPPERPDLQSWAHSLLLLHMVTAVITGLLIVVVSRQLQRRSFGTLGVVRLQMALCFTYLMYGVFVSYLDIHVGGVEAFILICCGVAGMSLMRPLMSITLYSVSIVTMLMLLRGGLEPGAHRAIMEVNASIAAVLSVVLSSIIFHQYARGLLLQRELEVLAAQDPLTQLPNRREIMQRIDKAVAMADRTGQSGALLFIDLDHFKSINDTRGHQVGDLLLQQVAQRLAASVRAADTVARLGGDEFLVLLQNLAKDAAEAAREADAVARKCTEVLNQAYSLAGLELRSSPSIGIALFSSGSASADELMRRADVAMYQAKDAGRNTVRFFDAEIQAALLETAELEAELRKALERNQMHLHFQPQVNSTGAVLGAEVLLRWVHPVRGGIAPGCFIPVAESCGLMEHIGVWVLAQACQTLARWSQDAALRDLTLAVNVSALQFGQPNFVEGVLAEMGKAGIDARCLKLELTESTLVSDMDDVITKMTALHQHGLRFSLDDFGTGYSSLSYIKRLPLDQLKIDQSFVHDVLEDPNDAAIVRVILGLAQTLGLDVIAEGVETPAQREFLEQAGCRQFQGYLLGRPMPQEMFEGLVRSSSANALSAS